MNRQLTDDEVFELSKAFHSLSTEIGNYRYNHWDELTVGQRTDLENKQWTLFNTASDLNAKSVLLKAKLADQDLVTLQSATKGMQEVAKKIQGIKHAIAIATKAIALSGAIYAAASTGNVGAVVSAASALISEIKGK